MNHNYTQTLDRIKDYHQELSERIKAALEIGSSGDVSMIKELLVLLKRKPQELPYTVKNWDVLGAERVVDLYIIDALNRLGCESENNRIPDIIARAGNILRGPDDELRNAAKVVTDIGSISIVEKIVELTKNNNAVILRNGVRTLNMVPLPYPPVGGPTDQIISPDLKGTFAIDNLKDEIETIAKLSKGAIFLTDSTRDFITTHNFERGRVIRQNESLREIVEEDLDVLELQYFQNDTTIFICTMKEAGNRWQSWWLHYGAALLYDVNLRKFTTKENPNS